MLVPLAARFQNLSGLISTEKHRDDIRMEISCVLSGFIGEDPEDTLLVVIYYGT